MFLISFPGRRLSATQKRRPSALKRNAARRRGLSVVSGKRRSVGRKMSVAPRRNQRKHSRSGEQGAFGVRSYVAAHNASERRLNVVQRRRLNRRLRRSVKRQWLSAVLGGLFLLGANVLHRKKL